MNKLLLNALRNTEETLLLELLEVDSSMLVDAFLDIIDEREEWLNEKVLYDQEA
jgi:hypothetical protein